MLERLEQAEARLRGFGGAAESTGPVQSDLLGGPAEPPLPRPMPGSGPRPVPANVPRGVPNREPGSTTRDAPTTTRPPSPPPPALRSSAEVWAAIVAEVIRVRPTLGHLLSEGVVVGEENGRLTVAVPNGSAFAHEQLRKPENKELVLEAGRRLQPGLRDIAFTAGGAPGSALAGTHPVVQAAIELFEGEITQVRTAPGARGRAAAEPTASGGEGS